ncbi:MAG: hypothetical protein ABW156_11850 [Jiangellaceae bacterium]
MTDVIVDDHQALVDRYAERIRRDVLVGGELGYAHAFVEALTDGDSHRSLARRDQRVRAVNAAAELVRTERRGVTR